MSSLAMIKIDNHQCHTGSHNEVQPEIDLLAVEFCSCVGWQPMLCITRMLAHQSLNPVQLNTKLGSNNVSVKPIEMSSIFILAAMESCLKQTGLDFRFVLDNCPWSGETKR